MTHHPDKPQGLGNTASLESWVLIPLACEDGPAENESRRWKETENIPRVSQFNLSHNYLINI